MSNGNRNVNKGIVGKEILVYHGSGKVIKFPSIERTIYNRDFGQGFYCSSSKEYAKRRAARFSIPIINVYNYSYYNKLQIKRFSAMTSEWLDFIANCRAGVAHSYDIVEGPVVGDRVYNYVDEYITKGLSMGVIHELEKCKYDALQVTFCTETSLETLTYVQYMEGLNVRECRE